VPRGEIIISPVKVEALHPRIVGDNLQVAIGGAAEIALDHGDLGVVPSAKDLIPVPAVGDLG